MGIMANSELGIAQGEDKLFKSKAEEKAEKEAKKAAKKAERDAKKGGKKGKDAVEENDVDNEDEGGEKNVEALSKLQVKDNLAAEVRVSTGVLESRPTQQDIKIGNFSMGLHGQELIQDCQIELTIGRRYGLIGQNGCGKTNFLDCLARREVPVPSHMDLYHLKEEAPPTDLSAVEAVVDFVKQQIAELHKQETEILDAHGPEDERLIHIYEKLDELEQSNFEADATKLLVGLGFSDKMLKKATKDMSGGWRMRVALARALFVSPTLLLLDEPTNHLDLEVGRCKLDPSLKATCFQPLKLRVHSAFNLNLVSPELAPLPGGLPAHVRLRL